MREILFRGKGANGKWMEGSLVKVTINGLAFQLIFADDFEFNSTSVKSKLHCCVDPSTIGQYTGLTANGKKIFEGDIVQFQTRGSTFKPLYVRWYEECAQFVVTERDGVRSYPMDRSWRYEILGNVCDNIELLREVDNGT